MYDSKRRIRNGWQAFTPALAQSQQERLQVETNLRRAADNGEFHLVYQPQVDLRHGRIVAAEALIRWQNLQLGEMRPDHFIGHAEITGDIVRIGSWVLREACRQVREWRDAGLGVVRVAVNVSYRQFLGEDLADTVRAALREYELPGAALELEFTERILIEDAPGHAQDLRRPARTGRDADHRRFRRRLQRAQLPAPVADPRAQAEPAVPAGRARQQVRRRGVPGGRRHRPQPRARAGGRRHRDRSAAAVPAAAGGTGRPGIPVRARLVAR